MKKVLISILSLIFIVSTITTVYAATGSVALNSSANSVIKGDTFTVTLAATGDNNVTGLKSTLVYDSTKLSLENKATSNGFTEAGVGNELNAGIISLDGITLSKTVTIYTFTFKALDTAEEGETEISVTNVELGLVNENSEQEDVTAANASVKVNIKADDTTAGSQGQIPETPEQGDEGNQGEQTPETPEAGEEGDQGGQTPETPEQGDTTAGDETNEKKDTTTKKDTNKKLPQTGVESFSIIAIVIIGAIAIVSYVSYKKYKNI